MNLNSWHSYCLGIDCVLETLRKKEARQFRTVAEHLQSRACIIATSAFFHLPMCSAPSLQRELEHTAS